MTNNLRSLLWLPVSLFWILLLPFAIVTLYSVIELQNAARAFYSPVQLEKKEGIVAKPDPRLAMLQTIALIHKLDDQQGKSETLEILDRKLLIARLDMLNARNDVRFAAIRILARQGVADATAQCTATRDIQTACFGKDDDNACVDDWMLIKKCADKAYGYWNNAQEKSAVATMDKLGETARRAGEYRNKLVALWPGANKLNADPLYPVAMSIREAKTRNLLMLFFAMPQGIILACFTSVMAVLGAGVSSLIQAYRQKARRTDALKSFLLAPIIGGLTGFMVFFVVSAGTSVLVQPSPIDASQAISNLSAPTLATLGVLAGLASEDAIAWLREKAIAFFRNPDNDAPPEPKEKEASKKA